MKKNSHSAMPRPSRRAGIAFAAMCCAVPFLAAPAAAQDLSAIIQQNMAFDQQSNQQLQSMQMQNQMQMQQLLQNYIQQYGPQLQQEYTQFIQSTGVQLSFEQFAYNHMATQGGLNPGPALAQQRRNFQAQQDAHGTVQEGYDSNGTNLRKRHFATDR